MEGNTLWALLTGSGRFPWVALDWETLGSRERVGWELGIGTSWGTWESWKSGTF